MKKSTRKAVFNTIPHATKNDNEYRCNHRKHFIQQPRLKTTNMQDESYSTQLQKREEMSKNIATLIETLCSKAQALKKKEYTKDVIHNTNPKRHRGRTRHSAPTIGNTLFKRRDSQARKNNKAQPDRHREQFLRGCLLILPTSLVIIFPFVWRFKRFRI